MPLNTVGNNRISCVRDADVHHRDVELAVGVVGVGADQHAAAVAAGVAERGQREVGDDLLGPSSTSRNGSSRSFDSSATIARL